MEGKEYVGIDGEMMMADDLVVMPGLELWGSP